MNVEGFTLTINSVSEDGVVEEVTFNLFDPEEACNGVETLINAYIDLLESYHELTETNYLKAAN